MSIASQAAKLFTPAPDNIEADPQVAGAINAVHDTENLAATLAAKHSKALLSLETAEKRLGQVALEAEQTGNESPYKKLLDDVAKLQSEVDRIHIAQSAAGEKINEAKVALHALGRTGLVKTFARLTKARTKTTERMMEGIAIYADAFSKLNELNDKIKFTWPDGAAPIGAFLTADEINRALSVELYRILPNPPLSVASKPSLPGAHSGSLLGNPKQLQPFADMIADANSRIVQLVETGPASQTKIAASVSHEPNNVSAQADAALRQVPSHTEADVFASLPKHAPIVMDLRSNKS